eukprot:6189888-Pleurochrysis_carterae.AAC.1
MAAAPLARTSSTLRGCISVEGWPLTADSRVRWTCDVVLQSKERERPLQLTAVASVRFKRHS